MTPLCSKALLSTLAALAAASSSACYPVHYSATPAVGGQVVSRATARPVAGASVIMTDRERGSVQTRTDGAGRFTLPPVQHWLIYPLLSDGLARPKGTLRVEAAGYRPFVQPEVGAFSLTPQGVGPRPGEENLRRLRITLTPDA